MRPPHERAQRAGQLQQLAEQRERMLASQTLQAEVEKQRLEAQWQQLAQQPAMLRTMDAEGVVIAERLQQIRRREQARLREAWQRAQRQVQQCRRELLQVRQEKGALEHLVARLGREAALHRGREEQKGLDESAQARYQQGRQ